MSANDAPLVTTILPSYNHARYVEEAVRSVWAQDYPNHKLVAIDDGSTDGSADILGRLGAESPIPMEVILKQNEGLSRTLNLGIEVAEGDYLNVCPSDDRFLPNKLRVLVDALELADREVAVAFGDRRGIDEEGDPFPYSPVRFDPMDGSRFFLDVIMGRVIMPAPAMLYRRSMFEELGGFNEHVMMEDWDIWLRVTNRLKMMFVPDVVVEYRCHPDQTHIVKVSRISADRLASFEKWVGEAPDLEDRKTLRATRAHLYHQVGVDFFRGGYKANAVRWLAKSISAQPLRINTWRMLFRSLPGGEESFQLARNAKNRFKGRAR